MKKRIVRIISLFMSLCLLMSLPVFSSAAVKGDVNGDGKVTAADARLTLRCSVQLEVFTAAQKKQRISTVTARLPQQMQERYFVCRWGLLTLQ